MKDRIKQIRQAAGKNQAEFGDIIGVSGAAISRWEAGDRSVPESAIRSICREFNISEQWLRDGIEPMRKESNRSEEVSTVVKQLFESRPESFKAALIAALLKMDTAENWAVLEKIFNSIEAEIQDAEKEKDP